MNSSVEAEREIGALHSIEDIVGAMKAYAGVTIRKTEETVPNIREYERNMLSALADVADHNPYPPSKKERGKRIVVAFGSSQGICGPYNEKVADAVAENSAEGDVLFVIGSRLQSALEARSVQYEYRGDSALSIEGIQKALTETTENIMNIYYSRGFLALVCLFTFVTVKGAEISVERILPPELERVSSPGESKNPILTYMDPGTIFSRVLEEFLYIGLYRCCVESLRSENWYRLRSMEGASETLKTHLSELKTLQKYLQQEEITEEMLEILGSGMFYGR
ncbi:MAG: FoF1 ATP synthase subunit gamma [Nitrospirota bacterium]